MIPGLFYLAIPSIYPGVFLNGRITMKFMREVFLQRLIYSFMDHLQ
ncbi:hypothetical protein BMETH_1566_0 [methanotrophic bacterial endosymbiont of Bathymodiolus sp.]|nr:hypothetical protein BMETH_1566_0 [methanotrophic bacterial endosymbiont of Bathymodiolus sp.]